MALQIYATVCISLSELQTADPSITYEFTQTHPEEFKKILYSLGIDTRYPIDEQDVTHRNRFGNIVTCPRWMANERCDHSWTESGNASYEAIAKSTDNKILTDLFRMRGMVESV